MTRRPAGRGPSRPHQAGRGAGPKRETRRLKLSDPNEPSNRPSHTIFQVLDDGEKAIWLRVGAAWLHQDTRGARLVFNSFPLTGRIVMRERDDENTSANGGGQ